MIRMFLVTLGVFTAALIAFSFLMGVSKMDITIKHEMQRHVVAEPFEAGDVIEVSPDGQRILSVLCNSTLPSDKRLSTEISSGYYNIVDHSQEKFISFVRNVQSSFGVKPEGGVAVPASDTLQFKGEVNRVVGRFRNGLSVDCVCDIAEAVVESKSIACVVEKSLVETRLVPDGNGAHKQRKTMGLSFRPDPLVFDDLAALKPICPGLNAEAIVPKGQKCGGNSGFTFDVVAKSKIGLIREVALQ